MPHRIDRSCGISFFGVVASDSVFISYVACERSGKMGSERYPVFGPRGMCVNATVLDSMGVPTSWDLQRDLPPVISTGAPPTISLFWNNSTCQV